MYNHSPTVINKIEDSPEKQHDKQPRTRNPAPQNSSETAPNKTTSPEKQA
jgi:hypothetical protein